MPRVPTDKPRPVANSSTQSRKNCGDNMGGQRGLVTGCHYRSTCSGGDNYSLGFRPLPIALQLGHYMCLRLSEADITEVRARKHPRNYGGTLVCCHPGKHFFVEECAVLLYLVWSFAPRCVASVKVYLLRQRISEQVKNQLEQVPVKKRTIASIFIWRSRYGKNV